MERLINIRPATEQDHSFIFDLSPRLAEVANIKWHTDEAIQKMQDDYITTTLAATEIPRETFIAEQNNQPLGFIHVRSHKDGISGESCGTVPLLAVSPDAQGLGVGKLLISAAESWAKDKGYRLLHLEVFANNQNAYGFYQNAGFEAETIHMIKEI